MTPRLRRALGRSVLRPGWGVAVYDTRLPGSEPVARGIVMESRRRMNPCGGRTIITRIAYYSAEFFGWDSCLVRHSHPRRVVAQHVSARHTYYKAGNGLGFSRKIVNHHRMLVIG